MKPATILCIIMLWSSQTAIGQTLNNALISADTMAVSQQRFAFLEGNSKDGQAIIKNLFHFYKHYISSQDGQRCRYSPSCSEYAFISIKKHGLVFGVMDFFDRFTRCNPTSPENYVFDKEKYIFIDPVE